MKIGFRPWLTSLFFVAVFLSAAQARAQSVSVFASPSTITNAGDDAQPTLVLSSPAPRHILVKLMLSGSAGPGDYVLFGPNLTTDGRVWTPSGHTAASIYAHAAAAGAPATASNVAAMT